MFGNPETTPGGRALKFYATVRLEVRRAEQLKQGTDIVGNRTKIKVVKTKWRHHLKWQKLISCMAKGFPRRRITRYGCGKDLISKSGAWYGYKEERIGQGRENAKQYMADHPEMMAEVFNWSVMHTASVTVQPLQKKQKVKKNYP